MPASTSAQQPQQPPESAAVRSKKRRRKRSAAAKDRSEKKEKRAWVDEWIRGAEEEEETDPAKKEDDVAEKRKGEEADEVVSSAPSSPLRAPCIPDELRFDHSPAYGEAFARVEARYEEKIGSLFMSPTIYIILSLGCNTPFFIYNFAERNLLFVRKLTC
jgi:hypothetical protein